jgi:ferredoxin
MLILNQVKRASHFVKITVAGPHRLPKLAESTLRKQARPNNGSLFCSHCGLCIALCSASVRKILSLESRNLLHNA